MSGLEIVGLVIGVIPLVIEGLKSYQSGLKAIGNGFRKRKMVDKLCQALLLQSNTIEELVKHLLLCSGCELPATLDIQTFNILNDPDVKSEVIEYLDQRYDVFVSMLDECKEILQELATKIAKLVPEQKSAALKDIIEGNKQASRGQVSFRARLKIVISSDNFDEDCDQLDKCITSMDRFLRLLSSNARLGEVQPSKKSRRVAKTLWKIRENMSNLYKAISNGWERDCHQQHEVKLRLEDRLDVGMRTKSKGKTKRPPLREFELIFAADVPTQGCLWHETCVHVLEPTAHDLSDQGLTQGVQPKQTKVKVTVVGPPEPQDTQQPIEIQGICSAIRQAQSDQGHAMFILLATSRFGRPHSHLDSYRSCQAKATVSLVDILKPSSNSKRQLPAPSWASKTSLALIFASNFLQLLQTPWAGTKLSCSAISFLHDSNNQVDF